VFRFGNSETTVKTGGSVFIRKVIHALICVEFLLILSHFFLFLRTNHHFRLKRIVVEGSHYINAEKIVDSLSFIQNTNIFDANLDRVGRALEKHPWIFSSSVRINHPGTLNISVQERVPIAILRGEYENAIDSEGLILGKMPSSIKSCLPNILGFSEKEVGTFIQNSGIKDIIEILGVLKKLKWFSNKCLSINKTTDGFYLLKFRREDFRVKISQKELISQIARLVSVLELFPDRIRVTGNRLFFDLTFPSRVIMRPLMEYGG